MPPVFPDAISDVKFKNFFKEWFPRSKTMLTDFLNSVMYKWNTKDEIIDVALYESEHLLKLLYKGGKQEVMFDNEFKREE